MEAVTDSTAGADSWSEEFSAALETQRARTQEFLASQRARLRRAEEELTSQLQRLGEELADGRRENRQTREDLDARAEVLREQTAALQRLKTELSEQQSAWEKLQEQARAQWQEWQQQLARCEEDFEHRRRQWEQAASAEQVELQRQVDQGRQRIEHLETDLRMARQEAAAQAVEAEQARSHCRQMEEERAQISAPAETASEDQTRLLAERDALARRLEEVQSELDYATLQLAAVKTDAQSGEENYHRRYKTALEDLKEIKAKNAALEQELAKCREAPPPGGAATGRKFQNWELEKQRILASLEADFDNENEEEAKQRLQIEEVVHKTETLLVEKDREIDELKHLLADQSGNLGAVAVGAAALGEVLDRDALIREARDDLKRLQEEMREKMRQAEVELSVERAKLARQRQDLEARARFLENYAPPEPSNPAPQKSTRGRWLERLGLKDAEK
ncbi:MAG: hypothetical protein JXB10_13020 [Pirellulales bacterium]|nr:hypothetical protein [Pirellulales bacterium]